MKKLNICIDIDGTITDPYYWLKMSNAYFNKNISKDQITEYQSYKVMGVTQEEYLNFYEKYKYKIHTEEKIREDAKIFLPKIKDMHNIYFVTARDKSLRILTLSYLKRNDIPFDKTFLLGSHHKVEMAKKLNCNIFIEDSLDNALELSENGFKVLLVDTNYNRKPLKQNIIRVYNWIEINDIINDETLLQEEAI